MLFYRYGHPWLPKLRKSTTKSLLSLRQKSQAMYMLLVGSTEDLIQLVSAWSVAISLKFLLRCADVVTCTCFGDHHVGTKWWSANLDSWFLLLLGVRLYPDYHYSCRSIWRHMHNVYSTKEWIHSLYAVDYMMNPSCSFSYWVSYL